MQVTLETRQIGDENVVIVENFSGGPDPLQNGCYKEQQRAAQKLQYRGSIKSYFGKIRGCQTCA